jgi:hypothetical protein
MKPSINLEAEIDDRNTDINTDSTEIIKAYFLP